MHALKPSTITPKKIVVGLSGIPSIGDVPIIEIANVKRREPTSKTFFLPNLAHHVGVKGVFIIYATAGIAK